MLPVVVTDVAGRDDGSRQWQALGSRWSKCASFRMVVAFPLGQGVFDCGVHALQLTRRCVAATASFFCRRMNDPHRRGRLFSDSSLTTLERSPHFNTTSNYSMNARRHFGRCTLPPERCLAHRVLSGREGDLPPETQHLRRPLHGDRGCGAQSSPRSGSPSWQAISADIDGCPAASDLAERPVGSPGA